MEQASCLCVEQASCVIQGGLEAQPLLPTKNSSVVEQASCLCVEQASCLCVEQASCLCVEQASCLLS
ncbi:hypothetical protein [Microcoleus sp. B9-D4]|uniref:hypothetical protein n=1 Tax=Microcoleus sp. B9-D4 TaxID=2818711 RepID=UPI002FD2BB6C